MYDDNVGEMMDEQETRKRFDEIRGNIPSGLAWTLFQHAITAARREGAREERERINIRFKDYDDFWAYLFDTDVEQKHLGGDENG